MPAAGLTKAVLKSDECDRMRHPIQRPVVLELLARAQRTGEAEPPPGPALALPRLLEDTEDAH